jgi:hypothetical protein
MHIFIFRIKTQSFHRVGRAKIPEAFATHERVCYPSNKCFVLRVSVCVCVFFFFLNREGLVRSQRTNVNRACLSFVV